MSGNALLKSVDLACGISRTDSCVASGWRRNSQDAASLTGSDTVVVRASSINRGEDEVIPSAGDK